MEIPGAVPVEKRLAVPLVWCTRCDCKVPMDHSHPEEAG